VARILGRVRARSRATLVDAARHDSARRVDVIVVIARVVAPVVVAPIVVVIDRRQLGKSRTSRPTVGRCG